MARNQLNLPLGLSSKPVETFTGTIGSNLTKAAFDPSTNSVWVTRFTSNQVTKINAITGAVIASYATPAVAYGVCYDPKNKAIWVTARGADQVRKFSAADGSEIGTYSTISQPVGCCYDPSTNSVWVCGLGGTIAKHNADTGASSGPYTSGTSTYDICYDPSTRSIWTANYADHTVRKFLAADGSVLGTFSVGTNPLGVVFDPYTNSVWSVNTGSDNLTKLRASDGSVLGTFAAGDAPQEAKFDPSTNTIWVTNYTNDFTSIHDPVTGAIVQRLYADGGQGMAFDTFHTAMWVFEFDGQRARRFLTGVSPALMLADLSNLPPAARDAIIAIAGEGGGGGSGWALAGNSGTSPGTDFLGTIDNQALVIKTNNIERMRLLTSGNVGINTATPGTQLEVRAINTGSGTHGAIRFTHPNNVNLGFQVGPTGIGIGVNVPNVEAWNFENGYFRIATNNLERMRITAAGTVGIGTASPIESALSLDIATLSSNNDRGLGVTNGSGTQWGTFTFPGAADRFVQGSTTVDLVIRNHINTGRILLATGDPGGSGILGMSITDAAAVIHTALNPNVNNARSIGTSSLTFAALHVQNIRGASGADSVSVEARRLADTSGNTAFQWSGTDNTSHRALRAGTGGLELGSSGTPWSTVYATTFRLAGSPNAITGGSIAMSCTAAGGGISMAGGDSNSGVTVAGAITITAGNKGTGTGGGVRGGALFLRSGNAGVGSSGQTDLRTGDGNEDSGKVLIQSGNATTGNSGNIELVTGTAAVTRGKIRFQDGTQGTDGRVWTSVDANGSGAWVPAASFTVTAGENLTIGDAVYISVGAADGGRTAGRAYKLDATMDARVEYAGIVTATVTSGNVATIQSAGEVSGLSGLSVGQPIWASVTTPGGFQTTAPSVMGQWIIQLGTCSSSTELLVNASGSATAIKITSSSAFNTPTSTVLTSGSGTYNTPAGVKWLRIRMVGAGAGGSGSGTTGAGNGNNGANTTFGLHTAGGGFGSAAAASDGAPATGGAGGTYTIGSGGVGVGINGEYGKPGFNNGAQSNTIGSHGEGGSSFFGGAGNGTSGNGQANSGSGGGGANGNNISSFRSGGGGGAGAYIDIIISAPAASYSYSVGTGGTGGTAGLGGNTGGIGAAGIIIIEEHYSSSPSMAFNKYNPVLSAGNITNQYIDLPHLVVPNSVDVTFDYSIGYEGVEYTLSTVGFITRLTFAGDWASGGGSPLIAGDQLRIKYAY